MHLILLLLLLLMLLVLGCHHLGMLGAAAALTLRERSVRVVRQGLFVPSNARLIAKTRQARLLQLASAGCAIAVIALPVV